MEYFLCNRKEGIVISAIRKSYMLRFIGRCLILICCASLCFAAPSQFEVLKGMNFFKAFSPLHLLWFVWVGDMVLQLIPAKKNIALGSKKLFKQYFSPADRLV